MFALFIIFIGLSTSLHTPCEAKSVDWMDEFPSPLSDLKPMVQKFLFEEKEAVLILFTKLNAVHIVLKLIRIGIPHLVLSAQSEIAYLDFFSSQNLAPKMVRRCIETPSVVVIFLERLLGDLQQAQQLFVLKPIEFRRNIIISVAKAVAYLHHNDIAHGDLKLENVLLIRRNSGEIKLIDFEKSGLNESRAYIGTAIYAPPEYFNTKRGLRLNMAQDRWSLALMCACIVKSSFINNYVTVVEKEVRAKRYERRHLSMLHRFIRQEFGTEYSEYAELFVSWLKFSPYQRPEVKEMLATFESMQS